MNDYRHGSHTVFSIHLHVVWITKYRHKVLRGAVAERVREVVREECRRQRVDILQGHISADHVHVLLSIPPQVTISRLIQQLKGKSAYLLLREFADDPATLLGATRVGARLFLPQQWRRHR
jgi:putative transposase